VNVREFVESFEKLSVEDQATVLKELRARKSEQPQSERCPGSMKEMAEQMMSQMESSRDPMAMCAEIMNLCRERLATCAARAPTPASAEGGPR